MKLENEWNPCLWCGEPIGEERAKDAIMRHQQPKYCSDECRRNTPARSLVLRVFSAALGVAKDDEAAWKRSFDSRVTIATSLDAGAAAFEIFFANKSKGKTK